MYNNLLDIFSSRAGPYDLLAYIIVGRAIVALPPSRVRSAVFAASNLAVVVYWLWDGPWKLVTACYVALVTVQMVLLSTASARKWATWIPILFPIVALVEVRSGPATILGLSYLAFRMAHSAYEIASGRAKRVGYFDYLSYCVFVPTLIVGPMSPISRFQQSFAERRSQTSVWQGLFRIILGLVKVRFLATLCEQLSFAVLWQDEFLHGPEDFVVSCAASLFHLYFNFSGFCDVVVAIAALIGIDVKENFDSPLLARNLREYWTRWHITLGDVANALVFTPLSHAFGRALGRRYVDVSVCLAVLVTFCVIGVWHGFALHYLLYGAAHGLGVCTVYIYDRWLKRRFDARQRKMYHASVWARGIGMTLTVAYVAATTFLFDNDMGDMSRIVHHMRWTAQVSEPGSAPNRNSPRADRSLGESTVRRVQMKFSPLVQKEGGAL